MRSADSIILVFEFCRRDSFDKLDQWLDDIRDNSNDPFIILFGNKVDSDSDKWEVTSEEVNKYAKERGFPFFEVSAKTGKGLNEGLLYIVNKMYDKKYEDNEESKDNNEIIIDENKIEKEKNKSDCVRNKKNKK